MIVLSREKDHGVVIGDNIIVKILDINHTTGDVQIGIVNPDGLPITDGNVLFNPPADCPPATT